MTTATLTVPRVLVVDDDAVDRAAVRRQLARAAAGFELLEAADLPEARRVLAIEAVDAVLLDHQLPGEDGLTLLRATRDPLALPPVVMLTGRGDAALAVAALKAGAVDYLVKDELGPERLATTLGNAIAGRRAERERREAVAALERGNRRSRAFLACTQTLLLDLVPARTLGRALLDLLRGLDAERLALLRLRRDEVDPGWDLAAQATTIDLAATESLPATAPWRPAWQRWRLAGTTGQVMLVDAAEAPEEERLELEAQGVRRALVAPFYLHGHWAGLLRCDRLRSTLDFTPEDARFLQSAGDILTVWIEQREPLR